MRTRGLFVCIACAVLMAACSQRRSDNLTMNVDENLMPTDANASVIINQMRAEENPHNYDEKEGRTYSYISAISDEDAKAGKAAGEVSTFEFRGVIDGLYRISSVDDQGRAEWYYECAKPCVIIKRYMSGTVTRLAYTPRSVIGAAFEDALNGRLEVAKEPPKQRPAVLTGHDASNVSSAGSSEFEPDTPRNVQPNENHSAVNSQDEARA